MQKGKEMKVRYKLLLGFLVCFMMLQKTGYPHPHVFVAQKLHIQFDEQGLAGIKVFWQFDDMFSNMITMDHDTDKNGELSPEEVSVIEEKAFSYIGKSGYFFFITIDGNPFQVKYVQDFNARLIYGKLIYEFVIPCHVKATDQMKKIRIATYDPNYYTAVYYVQDRPYSLFNTDPFETHSHIAEDKENPIYYEMVNPWTLFLDFKLKP